jgi:hypothetical protein
MDRVTRLIFGPLLILGGLWFIAMPFAFATMRFGGRETEPTWAEYLGEVFRGGVSSFSVGLILLVVGLFVAAPHKRLPGQGRGSNRRNG